MRCAFLFSDFSIIVALMLCTHITCSLYWAEPWDETHWNTQPYHTQTILTDWTIFRDIIRITFTNRPECKWIIFFRSSHCRYFHFVSTSPTFILFPTVLSHHTTRCASNVTWNNFSLVMDLLFTFFRIFVLGSNNLVLRMDNSYLQSYMELVLDLDISYTKPEIEFILKMNILYSICIIVYSEWVFCPWNIYFVLKLDICVLGIDDSSCL